MAVPQNKPQSSKITCEGVHFSVIKLQAWTQMGDFTMNLSKQNTNGDFYGLMCSSFFAPSISQPTRVTSSSANLIDNIFFNAPAFHKFSGIFVSHLSDTFHNFCYKKNLQTHSKTTAKNKKKFLKF